MNYPVKTISDIIPQRLLRYGISAAMSQSLASSHTSTGA